MKTLARPFRRAAADGTQDKLLAEEMPDDVKQQLQVCPGACVAARLANRRPEILQVHHDSSIT